MQLRNEAEFHHTALELLPVRRFDDAVLDTNPRCFANVIATQTVCKNDQQGAFALSQPFWKSGSRFFTLNPFEAPPTISNDTELVSSFS